MTPLLYCLAGALLTRGQNARAADAPTPVAFVGVAHIHTPGFIDDLKRRSGDVKVVCVWDHDAQRAATAAQKLGAAVVNDPAAIWTNPDIKAVVICSETDRHLELVTAAAKAHKHIYVEKPLGMEAKDAYEMAKAVEDAGVIFQTGYFMRGDPKILFIKQQIDKGSFGIITRIRACNVHSGALGGWFDNDWRWMADPKQAGVGGFGDLGTHSLDIMLWLCGDVSSATATISNGTARYPNCDETGAGLMTFANGAAGELAAGWDDVANPVSLEVFGTEGHATIVNDQLFFQCKKADGADGRTPWTQLPPGQSEPMDLFIDAIRGKRDVPLVSVREAAYRVAVMEAMYRGARNKSWETPATAAGK